MSQTRSPAVSAASSSVASQASWPDGSLSIVASYSQKFCYFIISLVLKLLFRDESYLVPEIRVDTDYAQAFSG